MKIHLPAKVGILGASGRMGQELISLLKKHSDPTLDFYAGFTKVGEAPFQILTQDSAKNCDVIIDFTLREATLSYLSIFEALKKPLVIGTTGFTKEDIQKIESLAHFCPVLLSSNMSVGVNLAFELLNHASKILPSEYQCHIVEAHHQHKKDKPSGTALTMKNILLKNRPTLNVPIDSIRGGDIVGEHTIYLLGENEKIEITHRAGSRTIFAQGALRAAQWITQQKPGFYAMSDVLKGDHP